MRLEYYQAVGNYVIAIAVFVSCMAFQALTTVAYSNVNNGDSAGRILGWSFFVVNLAIIAGLISNLMIHYNPSSDEGDGIDDYEVIIYRVLLYLALACLATGFFLFNSVIYNWNLGSSAVAGW